MTFRTESKLNVIAMTDNCLFTADPTPSITQGALEMPGVCGQLMTQQGLWAVTNDDN